MARNSQSSSSGPGWFATLGGALLLVVLGFGVGLLAGAVFEEPELVMDHLAGRTTDVPVEGVVAPQLPPSVAARAPRASEPEPEPAARPLGAPPTAATREPARPASQGSMPRPAAAPAPGPGFAIQVGAFGQEQSARELAKALESDGMPAFVERVAPGTAPYKVRVGPVPTRAEADRLAERLKGEYRLPTWVVDRRQG